jgi:hypothetical protein
MGPFYIYKDTISDILIYNINLTTIYNLGYLAAIIDYDIKKNKTQTKNRYNIYKNSFKLSNIKTLKDNLMRDFDINSIKTLPRVKSNPQLFSNTLACEFNINSEQKLLEKKQEFIKKKQNKKTDKKPIIKDPNETIMKNQQYFIDRQKRLQKKYKETMECIERMNINLQLQLIKK